MGRQVTNTYPSRKLIGSGLPAGHPSEKQLYVPSVTARMVHYFTDPSLGQAFPLLFMPWNMKSPVYWENPALHLLQPTINENSLYYSQFGIMLETQANPFLSAFSTIGTTWSVVIIHLVHPYLLGL